MTITLDVPPELEQPLQQAATLQGKDVRAYLLDMARLRLRRDVLTEAETALLLAINTPLPPEVRAERDALIAKQEQQSLSEDEQARLYDLIDQVELANAKRWQSITDLARLRGVSLPEVALELGIALPQN